jgi:putative PIN family toxin of toxin-antitoxin system
MLKVVFDTNIFISALHKWRGNPYKVYQKMIEGEFKLLISSEILEELMRILKKEFLWPNSKIEELNSLLRKTGDVILITDRADYIKANSSDNKFLECAICGKADYIVSGDKHLLDLREYEEIKILTPKGFLVEIDER